MGHLGPQLSSSTHIMPQLIEYLCDADWLLMITIHSQVYSKLHQVPVDFCYFSEFHYPTILCPWLVSPLSHSNLASIIIENLFLTLNIVTISNWCQCYFAPNHNSIIQDIIELLL